VIKGGFWLSFGLDPLQYIHFFGTNTHEFTDESMILHKMAGFLKVVVKDHHSRFLVSFRR